MLEETGVAYEPHRVSFDTNDQLSPEFQSLNPYNKIPVPLVRNLVGYYDAGNLVEIQRVVAEIRRTASSCSRLEDSGLM